ncbi:nicotinamide-nucleotide adenylyltransferase, partial [Tremellales sp. Uapishka_1]
MTTLSKEVQSQIQLASDTSFTSLEIVYKSSPSWPYPSSPASSSASHLTPHIAILDSSFNPPTTAHLSISLSSFPSLPTPHAYTSRLLLFSLRNVDKKLRANPTSSEATIAQRIEMMILHAKAMEKRAPHEPIAVGLLNEPTFVGKSRIVREYLAKGNEATRLTFLIGSDTLIRFFDEKYYPPGQMDGLLRGYFESGSGVVNVRRGEDQVEEEMVGREGVKEWVENGALRFLGDAEITLDGGGVSSSRVRKAVAKRQSVEGLVIPEIAEYIDAHKLYMT